MRYQRTYTRSAEWYGAGDESIFVPFRAASILFRRVPGTLCAVGERKILCAKSLKLPPYWGFCTAATDAAEGEISFTPQSASIAILGGVGVAPIVW